jgi:hypothetical protein
MPRGLTDAQKNYIGPVCWLAIVTDPAGADHYYAEEQILFAGNAYLPYLRIDSPPVLTRSASADSAEVAFLNADLTVGNLAAAQNWEGSLCRLFQLLIGLGSAVEIFRGLLNEGQQDDQALKFRLVSEGDFAQIDAQQRSYDPNCTLRFGKPQCGYDGAASTITEQLAERTADVHTFFTIGDSTLAMTLDEHKGRTVVITAGTGKGGKRRIFTNSATTITVENQFAVQPDGTSKFKVFEFSSGAPKFLFTSASSLAEATADIFSARTIGKTTLAMPVDAHKGDTIAIVGGTGAGQARKLKGNSATTFTIADAEADFAPAPDGTSIFRCLFRSCPKDFGQSCEIRARTHRYNGFPTLTPAVSGALPASAGNGLLGGGGGGGPIDGDRNKVPLTFNNL